MSHRTRRRALVAGASLLALYAIAGFVLLPALLRGSIERRAGTLLERDVAIERLRINPFALSVTVDGLRIDDRDRTPLLHWRRLYVDFAALRSLVRREWSFGEIRLIGASGRLALLPEGGLNIDDLVARLRGEPDATAPAEAPPPAVGIGRLRIEDASLSFVDRSGPMTFTTTLGPVRLDVRDFTTRRDEANAYAFRGRTETGETFAWDGTFSLDPLRSEGRFVLQGVRLTKYRPYYRGVVPFDIKDGRADLAAGYRAAWQYGSPSVAIAGASVDVRDLKLAEHDREEIAVDLPAVAVRGADVDLITGTATIGSVRARGGKVRVRKTADGRVNVVDMVMPFFQTPATPASRGAVAHSPTAAAAARAEQPAVRARLAEGILEDFALEAEDLSAGRPVRVGLDRIGLTLRDVDNVPGSTAKGTLDLRVGGTGTAHADGVLSLVGLKADLEVRLDDLDVRPLDPYVEPLLDLRVTSGAFSATGRVRADLVNAARPQFSFAGDARMDDFAAVDGRRRKELLRWDTVRMRGVDYSLERDRLHIADVDVVGAGAVLSVAPDGRINVLDVLRLAQPVSAEAPAAPAEATGDAPVSGAASAAAESATRSTLEISPSRNAVPAGAAPAPDSGDTRVARARLVRGRIRLDDETMTPPAVLAIGGLEGTIAGLSSRPGVRADVHLRMTVGDAAPVTLDGQVDPLGSEVFTDLALIGRGIDLAPLGPYAARYLGYTLDRARLDLDMRYRLDNRALEGTNVFTASPFLLGEKTDSPDATHLPVRLGLALLRDRNGRVALDVPVEGSLDDPTFRLGRVILRAVVNVFSKLVTSPFRLLARTFVGRDDVDLSVVEFAAGSAALPDDARPRLDALVRGLSERPGLTLGIAGSADPAVDTEALRRNRLEDLLRAEKWRSLGRRDRAVVAAENVAIDAVERPKYLKAAWKSVREMHPETRQATKPVTPEDLESRILAAIQVDAGDLATLAAARAQEVSAYISKAGIDSARLFLKGAGPEAAPRVTLELQ